MASAPDAATLKGGKGSFFEGGVRVPTFMSYPRLIQAGSTCDTPITSVDFMPTFAELAGAKLPTNQPVDGTSIVPMMRKLPMKERSIFWHYPLYLTSSNVGRVLPVAGTTRMYWRAVPSSMIMRGDWKLIHYFEDNSFKLYNLVKDVSESKDLSPEFPEIVKSLTEELRIWQKETKAPIPQTINETFKPAATGSKKKGKKKQ